MVTTDMRSHSLPDCINFTDYQLHQKCFSCFTELRRKGKLCDVTLLTEGKRFSAHKIVLATTIPYFRCMFLNDMLETELHTITVNGLDPTLCPQTVLRVREFAQSIHCQSLVEACNDFVAFNFHQLSSHPAFLRLPFSDFSYFLRRDDLLIDDEETLFHIVIAWIECQDHQLSTQSDSDSYCDFSAILLDKSLETEGERSGGDALSQCSLLSTESRQFNSNRVSQLPQLLSCIRLPLVSIEFLSQIVAKHPLVKENLLCRDLIDEVRDMFMLTNFISNSFASTSPRRSWRCDGTIYVVGGSSRDHQGTACFEVLEPTRMSRVKQWKALNSSLPVTRRRLSIVSLNGFIYAIGGFDGNDRVNCVDRYNPSTNQWQSMAPLLRKRSAFGVSVFNNRIYVTGGFDGNRALSECEFYDPDADRWTLLPPMLDNRMSCGTAVVSFGGSDSARLYVVGGYVGSTVHASVEYLNISDRALSCCRSPPTWHDTVGLHSPRCHLGISVLADRYLIVAGGHSGLACMDSVEMLDVKASLPHWTSIASLSSPPRSLLSLVTSNGVLYAIGGFDGTRNLSTVECFQPSDSEFEKLLPPEHSKSISPSNEYTTVSSNAALVQSQSTGHTDLKSWHWVSLPSLVGHAGSVAATVMSTKWHA